MNLYLRISEQVEIDQLKLTTTEEAIMKYIYENIEAIDDIGVIQIANNCHCSTAAIHRFVKKFGCDGYKQFKTELVSGKRIIKFSNSKFQLKMNELVTYIQTLDVSRFREHLFTKENKRVYIYGIGGSYVSAQYLARQLNRYGIDASAYQPSERVGLTDLADAFIFISHSGETGFIIDKITQVKLDKMPIFAITKENSTISKLADVALVHNNFFNKDNFNQKESQLATILLIEKLFYDLN